MNDVVDVVFIDLHGAVINKEYLGRQNVHYYIGMSDIKNVELPQDLYPNSGTFFSYGVDGVVHGKYASRTADSAFGYSTLEKIFDTSITRNNCAVKDVIMKDGFNHPTKIEHAANFKYGPTFPNMVFARLTNHEKEITEKYGTIQTPGNRKSGGTGGIYYFNGDAQKIIEHVDVKPYGETLEDVINTTLPEIRRKHNRTDKHVYIFLHTCLGENIHKQYLKNTPFNNSRRYFQSVAEELPPLEFESLRPYVDRISVNDTIYRRGTEMLTNTRNFSPPDNFNDVRAFSPVRTQTNKRRKLTGGKKKKSKRKLKKKKKTNRKKKTKKSRN